MFKYGITLLWSLLWGSGTLNGANRFYSFYLFFKLLLFPILTFELLRFSKCTNSCFCKQILKSGEIGLFNFFCFKFKKNARPSFTNIPGERERIYQGRMKMMMFLKMDFYRPLFLYFRLFFTVDRKQMFYIKVCWWLHSNCRPQVLEATALPTESQPLPIIVVGIEKVCYLLATCQLVRTWSCSRWSIRISGSRTGSKH